MSSPQRSLTLPLASVFLISLLMTGCGKPGGAAGRPGGAGGGVPVEVMAIKEQPVSHYEDYQATLISRQSVVFQPRVPGQVSAIYVKPGDHVNAGATLLQVDPRQQQAAVSSTQADAAAMKAQIKQTQDNVQSLLEQRTALVSNLELSRTQMTRYNNLYSKGAVSKQAVDQYSNALDKAKSDLESNDAQIKAQQSAVVTATKNYERSVASSGQASTLLQFYKITTPFAGTVGDIPVKVGTYVAVDTPLLSVTDNDNLELNIGLPASKAFDAKIGLKAEILDNASKPVHEAKVSFVSPVVDTSTQTILTKSIVKNPNHILKANQSVKARVYYSTDEGILVPTDAVSHMGGQDFVFMVYQKQKSGSFFVKQTPVKLGPIQNGSQYVVTSGLQHDNVIVSHGIQKLMDNAPVMLPKQMKEMQKSQKAGH